MTRRRLMLSCAAAVLVLSSAAGGQPLPATSRSATGGVFLASLFAKPKPRLPVATAAPMNVLPPAAKAAVKTAEQVAGRVPPLPRLRPTYAAAGSPPAPTPAGAAGGIDQTVTGSIDSTTPAGEPPSANPPVQAVAAPPLTDGAASQAAARRVITTVERSDGLLGDPSDYFGDEPAAPQPNMRAPETVQGPKGEAPPSAGQDAAALAAVPLLGTAPFELVRTLQDLQDRMAQGDVQAIAAQRALMGQIDSVFMAAEPAVWQDSRNAAAAVTYVLSGGRPDILARLVVLDPPAAIGQHLLQGVLGYANGKADAAAPLLADIDPTTLPASMAGQVAIAQSALAVKSDPAKAMKLLSVARLMAPGTLVEEAAIRRQLLVADRQRDEDEVRSLARQYLDRFRHSVYAGNFRARFAAALSHMAFLDSEDRFTELDDMLAMVEPESRCDLYLTVALASAINGRAAAARLAAERASGLALAGSAEEARAKLYHAAALAAIPQMADKGTGDLAGLDRNLLSASDVALYDDVHATLDGVIAGTDLVRIDVAAAAPLGEGAMVEQPEVVKKAQAALDDTAKLVATTK